MRRDEVALTYGVERDCTAGRALYELSKCGPIMRTAEYSRLHDGRGHMSQRYARNMPCGKRHVWAAAMLLVTALLTVHVTCQASTGQRDVCEGGARDTCTVGDAQEAESQVAGNAEAAAQGAVILVKTDDEKDSSAQGVANSTGEKAHTVHETKIDGAQVVHEENGVEMDAADAEDATQSEKDGRRTSQYGPLLFDEELEVYVAYFMLIAMAISAVWLGSILFTSCVEDEQLVRERNAAQETSDAPFRPVVESPYLAASDVCAFPLMGSVTLLGLYLAYKYLSRDIVNSIVTGYFLLVSVYTSMSVSELLYAMVKRLTLDEREACPALQEHSCKLFRIPVIAARLLLMAPNGFTLADAGDHGEQGKAAATGQGRSDDTTEQEQEVVSEASDDADEMDDREMSVVVEGSTSDDMEAGSGDEEKAKEVAAPAQIAPVDMYYTDERTCCDRHPRESIVT